MGRPSSPNLPVRGRDRPALSNEEMVLPQGLGNEARQEDWREEGEGRHCAQDRRCSALHLGRRHIIRLGPGEGSLIRFVKFLVRSAGLAMSRWDGVVATSFIRLVGGLTVLRCRR